MYFWRMKSLVALIFLMILSRANGQIESWVEVRPKAGFLVAHRSIMGHVATQHAYATEISYYFRSKGVRFWDDDYNYPRYGISGFIGSVGNNELLGRYFGAYGFISIPLIHTKSYEFCGRLGTGLGFAPKVYDNVTNNLSIGTSTHVNALVSLSLENRYQFGPHAINFIVDMTHFSNGATKVPNLGLNVPYISLGYGYKVNEVKTKTNSEMKAFAQRWEFGAMGLASVKEVYPVGGKKFPIFGLNAVARRYFKPTVGAELSFDLMYKGSLRTYAPDVPMTDSELLQVGAFAGYLLPFDQFHIVVGMGYYIRDKFKFQEPFYHRIGLRYVFDNGLNVNLVLKSHWARADYIEYGIGYTFKR